MTKADLINLLATVDDYVFELSYYGYQPHGELWLKISFATTVEDLD